MSIYEIMVNRRTIRKFSQEQISEEVVNKLLDAARNAPSAANLQPVRYKIISEEQMKRKLFKEIKWAKYINPNGTPKENEEPTLYIAVLIDKAVQATGYEMLDIGLALQNIILLAAEQGLGSCIVAAFNRKKIYQLLNMPEQYALHVILALGYKNEHVIVEDLKDGSIKYYKDVSGFLHVPKRGLENIIVK